MTLIRSVFVLTAAAALSGCAAAPSSRDSAAPEPSPPLPVVRLTAASAPGFGGVPQGDEYARRDAVLALRPPLTAFDQTAWRSPARLMLERVRRVTVSQRPGTYTYYTHERRRIRH